MPVTTHVQPLVVPGANLMAVVGGGGEQAGLF